MDSTDRPNCYNIIPKTISYDKLNLYHYEVSHFYNLIQLIFLFITILHCIIHNYNTKLLINKLWLLFFIKNLNIIKLIFFNFIINIIFFFGFK